MQLVEGNNKKKYILVLYCMFGLMERDRMESYIVWIVSNGSQYCGHGCLLHCRPLYCGKIRVNCDQTDKIVVVMPL